MSRGARNLTFAFFGLLAFGAVSPMMFGVARFPQWMEIVLGGAFANSETIHASPNEFAARMPAMRSGQMVRGPGSCMTPNRHLAISAAT